MIVNFPSHYIPVESIYANGMSQFQLQFAKAYGFPGFRFQYAPNELEDTNKTKEKNNSSFRVTKFASYIKNRQKITPLRNPKPTGPEIIVISNWLPTYADRKEKLYPIRVIYGFVYEYRAPFVTFATLANSPDQTWEIPQRN